MSSLCIGNGLGRGKEWVKESQLVLTSHSTHIAPEGGAEFISSAQSTNTHTHTHTHKGACILLHICTHIRKHTHTHTHKDTDKHASRKRRVSPNWLGYIHKPAQRLWLLHLSAMLSSFDRGLRRSLASYINYVSLEEQYGEEQWNSWDIIETMLGAHATRKSAVPDLRV